MVSKMSPKFEEDGYYSYPYLKYSCAYPDEHGEVNCPFSCDCLDCQYVRKGGETEMRQSVFDSTDYGEMTLAKLDSKGVEFLLKSVEKTTGKWGAFVTLLGQKDGKEYEIRAGGRAATGFIAREEELVGKVIYIVPTGIGMDRTYDVGLVK
jgi:hypothetical protein